MRFFLKIFFTLILGAAASLLYLSKDQRCIDLVHEKISLLVERDFGLHFSGTIASLSFLPPSVTFATGVLRALSGEQAWSVHVERAKFSFSLGHFLPSRCAGITVDLEGLSIFSEMRGGKSALVEAVRKILARPGRMPIQLDACTCPDLSLMLEEKEQGTACSSSGALGITRTNNGYRGKLLFDGGEVVASEKKLLTNLKGTIECMYQGTVDDSLVRTDLLCTLPLIAQQGEVCHLVGHWQGARGTYSCTSDAHSLEVERMVVELQKNGIYVQAKGSVALAAGMRLARFPQAAYVAGDCSWQVEGIMGQALRGTAAIQQSQVAGWWIESLKTSFEATPALIAGKIEYEQEDERLIGEWLWNIPIRSFQFTLSNPTPFTLFGTQWHMPEGQTSVAGTFCPGKGGSAHYQLLCEREKTESLFKTTGVVTLDGSALSAQASAVAGDSTYAIHIASDGPLSVEVREMKNEGATPLVTITHRELHTSARIDLSLLQKIVSEYTTTSLYAQGALTVEGDWDGSEFLGTLRADDSMVRLPSTYNFIHDLQTDFSCNFLKRTLVLKNLKIFLQKGMIESALLQVGYDAIRQGVWAHLPVTFSDCFINWNKDLYLLFSGAMVAKKVPQTCLAVDGFIVLDRSQLKENIFSQKTQQRLREIGAHPASEKKVNARISISSRVPLAVKTEQLETNAHLALVVSAGGDQVELDGHITLQGGAIHFPAHSLSIVRGKLLFTPQDTADPLIELTAQERIKRYLITLTIAGTGDDPHLIFDSIPALSEEQIMMLLIAGSEEESLNIVAPALVMRSIENVIFGPGYRSRHDAWLEPLKRIKFVPRFTDQTGRGGFKGALEIEVSKRLRGMIEKNFSLTEDVAYGIEYLLTDDVSIRASCDERGDLGAELEMRFKF